VIDPATCEDCSRDLNRFNPACVGCGGRYLRDVKRRRMGQDTKVEWLRSILKTWMDYGHAEADLRALSQPKNK
jgi:hypothetical protein